MELINIIIRLFFSAAEAAFLNTSLPLDKKEKDRWYESELVK